MRGAHAANDDHLRPPAIRITFHFLLSTFRLSSPIHHTFAPLGDRRQRLLALRLLLRPWTWRNGPETSTFRSALSQHLHGDVALFSTGREALRALFHALHIGHGDEVIVQAYTCVVVVNAVAAAGATPVYVDILKDTLSMDPQELPRKITPRTKAVVCQHTFGVPAPLRELKRICDERGIPLIEDCAHIIPDASGPPDIARTGDFVLLSFGRDKAISGVAGGAMLSRNTDVSDRLRKLEQTAPHLSLFSIKRYLLYPLLYAVARPVFGIGVGKALLKLCALARILPPIVTDDEKDGRQSQELHRLPNACAALALEQLGRLREINDHRRMLARYYAEAAAAHGWGALRGITADLPLQKHPMFVEGAERIRQELRRKNIHLHDGWTGCVICPSSVDPSRLGYADGDDPRAEEVCEQILTLPTHPTMTAEQARTLVDILKNECITLHS